MSTPPTETSRTVKVWDIPTRIFHWTIVVCVITALASQEAEGSAQWIHVYSGSLLIGFMVFRLVWGVIGSRHARFTDFVHSFSVVKGYAKRLLVFNPPYVLGHNPLGGWMVVALIVMTFLASITGLMTTEDDFTGPLAHIGNGAFGEAHEGLGSTLMVLAIIHVIGVIGHSFISGENLPRTMVNGIKHVPGDEKVESITSVGIVRPIVALILGVASVWYLFQI